MTSRKPPSQRDPVYRGGRHARAIQSMAPGTLQGRMANASPVRPVSAVSYPAVAAVVAETDNNHPGTGVDSIQLGVDAEATHQHSTALGRGAKTEADYQMMLGNVVDGTMVTVGGMLVPSELVVSHPTMPAIGVKTTAWQVMKAGYIYWMGTTLSTAGSSTTQVRLYKNGVYVQGGWLYAGNLATQEWFEIPVVAFDRLQLDVAIAGTGASGLTVQVRTK